MTNIFIIILLSTSVDVDFQVERDVDLIPSVVVNYKIPYSEISFYSEDSLFVARYSVSLTIKQGNRQISGKNERKEVKVYDYAKTISPNIHSSGILKQRFSQGTYKITLNIWDLQSNRRWKEERDILIPDMEPLDIGSVQWLGDPSYLIYTDDTVRFKIIIYDSEEKGAYLTYYFESEVGSVYYETDTLFKGEKKYIISGHLSAKYFPESKYKLVTILKSINMKEVRRNTLEFEIREPFFHSRRYIKKVKQLKYIATPKEMENLLNARTEKRQELWEQFWRKRDPTHGDEINEFREEYFRRVDYAQEHFSTGLTEGWKTDKGKVYIYFGPPDLVERHPFEIQGKAYDIWYYYDSGYRLIFVERYNLGEYELKNPPRGF